MDNAPNRIWLQWYGDGDPDEPGEPEHEGITWCQDKINDHDIEYVRWSWRERADAIEEAAKNLIAQKGRHNTEQAYKRLVEAVNGSIGGLPGGANSQA